MRGLSWRAASLSFPAAPLQFRSADLWLCGLLADALNYRGKGELSRGVDSKEGMDAVGVVLPPIRASSPQSVHCHQGAEGRVRQTAEGLHAWPGCKIRELVPRVSTEWGNPLALSCLTGSMRGNLGIGCRRSGRICRGWALGLLGVESPHGWQGGRNWL